MVTNVRHEWNGECWLAATAARTCRKQRNYWPIFWSLVTWSDGKAWQKSLIPYIFHFYFFKLKLKLLGKNMTDTESSKNLLKPCKRTTVKIGWESPIVIFCRLKCHPSKVLTKPVWLNFSMLMQNANPVSTMVLLLLKIGCFKFTWPSPNSQTTSLSFFVLFKLLNHW